jgi:aerobic-type carbon monoxide dehydrogenase small subunit (CoxS/CutS family)
MNEVEFRLRVNGEERTGRCEPRMTLADFLRGELGLTGTHLGCEHGVCGACTVLVDGATTRSCLMLAVQASGAEVTTIEGLGTPERPHPLMRAFSEMHGLQCGFCTPGFIVSAVEYLREHPEPDRQSMGTELSGNICRCTGYVKIFAAVERAAELMKAEGVR